MANEFQTSADYLKSLPEDRRQALTKIRAVIRKNLPKGFAESMQYGMISWVVPHKIYPAGYHCDPKQAVPFVSLASHKSGISLYLMTAYADPAMAAWLKESFQSAGKKLDMGKSCLRFKKLEDVPLDVIGEAVAKVSLEDYLVRYESALKGARKKK